MQAQIIYTVVRTEEFIHDLQIDNKEVVTLNVYRDVPEYQNEKGQLLYHFDIECSHDELYAVLDAYKASKYWENFPLYLCEDNPIPFKKNPVL